MRKKTNCPICELFHSKDSDLIEEDLIAQAAHLRECDEGYNECKGFIYRFGIDMWDIPLDKRKKFKENINKMSRDKNIDLWYESLRRILVVDDSNYENISKNMDSREEFIDSWSKKMEERDEG